MRKENRKYYFSVEGETEKLYLEWLQRTINADPNSCFTIVLDCPVQKDPLKRAKTLISLGRTEITHMFDYESNDSAHTVQFKATLDRMKEAQGPNVGKKIVYHLGYTNFSFELWILLHKINCSSPLVHRRQYLSLLNRAFDEQFENLKQYKKEDNFRGLLNKLTLNDVRQAISRAKIITQNNEQNNFTLLQYKGYHYYKENPSLSIWESIEKILIDCKL